MPTPAHPRPRALLRLPALLFAPLLLIAATLFFAGDIGKWNDDYFFLNQFHRTGDPGAPMPVRSYTLDAPLHFWRPLYRYAWTPVVVALYQTRFALHTLGAIVHAGVCLALFALLRRLGISRTPASIAALAFAVYPAPFEAVFWSSCTPTAIATGAVLALIWLQLIWLERPDTPRPLWIPLAAALITFATCAANEQPAFAALALPVLAWTHPRGGTPRNRLTDLAPALAAALVLAAYLTVHFHFYPGHPGPTAGGTATLDLLPSRLTDFARDVWSRQTLHHFGPGALREGLAALTEHPARAGTLALALLLSGAAWIVVKPLPAPTSHIPHPTSRILLGLAIFAAAWSPISIIYYPAAPRLAYAPSLGLAIALAGALQALLRRLPRAHTAARFAALPALLAGALTMIGVQHAYRARWLADRDQARQLLALVPNPAPTPRPVFIPVRVADHPVHTGAPEFDGYFRPPLTSRWSAGWWLQGAYRREDVLCVQCPFDQTMPLADLGDGHVRTGSATVPPAKSPLHTFKWSQVVPFEIDPDGRVLLYTHARARIPGSPDQEFALPLAAPALEAGLAPRRVLAVPRAAAP